VSWGGIFHGPFTVACQTLNRCHWWHPAGDAHHCSEGYFSMPRRYSGGHPPARPAQQACFRHGHLAPVCHAWRGGRTQPPWQAGHNLQFLRRGLRSLAGTGWVQWRVPQNPLQVIDGGKAMSEPVLLSPGATWAHL